MSCPNILGVYEESVHVVLLTHVIVLPFCEPPSTRLMSAFCNIQQVTLPVAVTVQEYCLVSLSCKISVPKKSSPPKVDVVCEPSSKMATDSVGNLVNKVSDAEDKAWFKTALK